MTDRQGISRRHLLAGAGALGAAGAVGAGVAVTADAVAHDGGPVTRRVDFHGAHQAGIATPVQGHLHFASFDVTTTDRAALAVAAPGLDRRGPRDDRRQAHRRAHGREPAGAAVRHRRGGRPRRREPHAHRRVRAVALRRPVRPGGRPTRSAGGPAGLPGRHPRPRALRRRPRGAGLLGRPAGRRARRTQPHADRRRPGRGAVGPARLRQGLVDGHGRTDAAQPLRLQGRHRQRPR